MRRGLLGMLIALMLTACAINKPENLETQARTGWYNLGGMIETIPSASIISSRTQVHNDIPTIAFTQCVLPCG